MEEKDKIIKIQKYANIAKSYKWDDERCKNTFGPSLWVAVLIDFLYNATNTSSLEKKYTNLMVRVNKNSKEMYTNSLLRKFQLNSKQNFLKIRSHFSKEEIENWIVNWINSITKKHYKFAVPKAKKMIENWNSYYKEVYVNKSANYNENVIQKIKKVQMQKSKIKWHKYNEKNNIKQIDLLNDEKDYENQNEIIQKWGKFYFYDELINKFGSNNVLHNKEIFSSTNSNYDFLVMKNDKKHYYQVRTTKRSTLRFYINRGEYEFWKKCQKEKYDYSLILVKNLYYDKFSNLPLIEEIENPEFQININKYGYLNEKIIIAPSQFIGKV